jgi:hypothetical protein
MAALSVLPGVLAGSAIAAGSSFSILSCAGKLEESTHAGLLQDLFLGVFGRFEFRRRH